MSGHDHSSSPRASLRESSWLYPSIRLTSSLDPFLKKNLTGLAVDDAKRNRLNPSSVNRSLMNRKWLAGCLSVSNRECVVVCIYTHSDGYRGK